MTSPLNREELAQELEYTITLEYKAPNGEPAKSRIDRMMRYIDQYAQQVAIEAEKKAYHNGYSAGYEVGSKYYLKNMPARKVSYVCSVCGKISDELEKERKQPKP